MAGFHRTAASSELRVPVVAVEVAPPGELPLVLPGFGAGCPGRAGCRCGGLPGVQGGLLLRPPAQHRLQLAEDPADGGEQGLERGHRRDLAVLVPLVAAHHEHCRVRYDLAPAPKLARMSRTIVPQWSRPRSTGPPPGVSSSPGLTVSGPANDARW